MATMNQNTPSSQQTPQSTQASGGAQSTAQSPRGVGSPVSNECYNVITALQAKLEGLEAYRKYAADGNEQIWQQLMPHEEQAVGLLLDQLEQLVKAGRLRGGQAGGTGATQGSAGGGQGSTGRA